MGWCSLATILPGANQPTLYLEMTGWSNAPCIGTRFSTELAGITHLRLCVEKLQIQSTLSPRPSCAIIELQMNLHQTVQQAVIQSRQPDNRRYAQPLRLS